MIGVFDNYGVRFSYPSDWDLKHDHEGPRTNVVLTAPDGLTFAMMTIDETCPPPDEEAESALETMRTLYPDLEAEPASETIDGHPSVGHDLEFVTLDIPSACAIRCFRTERRTVLVFGQWADLGGDEPSEQLEGIRASIEETDA